MMNMNDGLYIGVDGCRDGWIACVLNHGELRFERFDNKLTETEYTGSDYTLIPG